MLWDADSLNGEQFLKYKKGALQSNPFMKMPGDLLVMLLFANKMVLFQLSNQRYYLTVLIQLNNANV